MILRLLLRVALAAQRVEEARFGVDAHDFHAHVLRRTSS